MAIYNNMHERKANDIYMNNHNPTIATNRYNPVTAHSIAKGLMLGPHPSQLNH
jgi:hypothetical protein